MNKIIIIGAGGHSKEIIKLARDCGREVAGVLDDSLELHNKTICEIPVLGSICDWHKYRDVDLVIAIGSPRARYHVYKRIIALGNPTFAKLIHPSVIISDQRNVGVGTVICARCTVNVEVTIGEHCILNVNTTIAHESILEDFVTVAPMAVISGNVQLQRYVEVGTGAVIKQGLVIGKGGMLGMGAIQLKNIPQNTVFIGNPARKYQVLTAVE